MPDRLGNQRLYATIKVVQFWLGHLGLCSLNQRSYSSLNAALGLLERLGKAAPRCGRASKCPVPESQQVGHVRAARSRDARLVLLRAIEGALVQPIRQPMIGTELGD